MLQSFRADAVGGLPVMPSSTASSVFGMAVNVAATVVVGSCAVTLALLDWQAI